MIVRKTIFLSIPTATREIARPFYSSDTIKGIRDRAKFIANQNSYLIQRSSDINLSTVYSA